MVICDYCNRPAKQVSGQSIYPHRPDLAHLQYWSCQPCGAYVGTHKHSNAKPLGRLANAELRRAKQRAHAAFDPIWRSSSMSRSKAYKWLASALNIEPDKCHIGMFDVDMCVRVVEACQSQEVRRNA